MTTPYPPYDQLAPREWAGVQMAILEQDPEWADDMTAYRLAWYLRHILSDQSPMPHLTTFPNTHPGASVHLPSIDFWSSCSHHLLPFFGTVEITYMPGDELMGLSKIPLLVRWCAQRPCLQEELCAGIAHTLANACSALMVAVTIKAQHTCQLLDLGQPPIPVMETTYVWAAGDADDESMVFSM